MILAWQGYSRQQTADAVQQEAGLCHGTETDMAKLSSLMNEELTLLEVVEVEARWVRQWRAKVEELVRRLATGEPGSVGHRVAGLLKPGDLSRNG